jgi:hypothetical protein
MLIRPIFLKITLLSRFINGSYDFDYKYYKSFWTVVINIWIY